MNISWDAEGYKKNFGFVPAYGEAVMDLIDAGPGAACVDLGCGNGDLTAKLAARGFDVLGIDASPEMLELAYAAHPELRFKQADATAFKLDETVDVVFSNAMLHWIDRELQPAALARIAAALKPGGQFVFECGGHACCAQIHEALAKAFAARGLDYRMPFSFYTVGEYAPIVEAAGMRVTYAALFDRPTALKGPNGMEDWIRMFDARPFEGLDDALVDELIAAAVNDLRGTELFQDGTWIADYTRLRMRAVKAR